MKIFSVIRKVDEEKRLVYGRAVQEHPDESGEIFDYESSKPNFAKWSQMTKDASGGESLGNLRAMHGKVAAGKLVDIEFNDPELAIDIITKIVDDNEWKKVLEGVYTGFSIGGRYLKKWDDGDLVRYTADPSEISLVDRPCIPTATFFDVQKADGSVLQKQFQISAEPENENDLMVVGTDDEVKSLVKRMTEKKMSLADVLKRVDTDDVINTDDTDKPAVTDQPVEKADFKTELKKYIGQEVDDTQSAVNALMNLMYLYASESQESHPEASAQTEALKSAIEGIKAFIASEIMENDDTDGAGMNEGHPIEMAAKAGDLQKAGARNSKSDSEKIQAVHDHAVGLGADCSGTKADAGKSAETENLLKIIDDLTGRIEKIEKQPMKKSILRVVSKGDEINKLEAPKTEITDDDDATSALKKIHMSGGSRLRI